MEKVYITGHKNPDLDSILSSLAYANLKSKLSTEYEYIPVRCGHLSENIKKILDAFNIKSPIYKPDVYPKVSDVMFSHNIKFNINDTLYDLASIYSESNPHALPVFDGDKFYGLVSTDDVSNWCLNELKKNKNLNNIPKIKDFMTTSDLRFDVNDMLEDCKKQMTKSPVRGIPVFDNDKYLGYVTRRCFLRSPKYNVILVDHNEPKQSINGIETANVLEIIDHHRIDAVKTELPVFIDAEPLGSTCTIIYQLYLRNKIEVEPYYAKVLLTGILSDTLILKSPTTTAIDIKSASELASICKVDVKEFGMKMFSHVERLSSRNPKEAVTADFKVYTEGRCRFGICQCEVTTLHDLDEYKDTYLSVIEDVRNENALDVVLMMVTDIVKEKSILLTTNHKVLSYLPYKQIEPRLFDMPGVMSRKKQLLPEIINTIDMYFN